VGGHNRENCAAAALAALAAGADIQGVQRALDRFRGLAHRIEFAGSVGGVDFYDDSKGTNPDAVVRAMESFDRPIVLILGGRSKDTDFSCLREPVRQKARQVVAMGESRQEISRALAGVCGLSLAASMAEAVDLAYQAARPGDVVLLSPACASFDLYENYAQRGRDFVRRVMGLKEGCK
jgi:UDP-N-acetylmuramoylalanine--D-glutamate ligase